MPLNCNWIVEFIGTAPANEIDKRKIFDQITVVIKLDAVQKRIQLLEWKRDQIDYLRIINGINLSDFLMIDMFYWTCHSE